MSFNIYGIYAPILRFSDCVNVANGHNGFKEFQNSRCVHTNLFIGYWGRQACWQWVTVENVRQQFSQGNISGLKPHTPRTTIRRSRLSIKRSRFIYLDKEGYVAPQ
jgi:hypothetical protein